MSAVYDNWERLVAATLKREQLRQIALSHSRESSFSSDFSVDFSSRFSFHSPVHDVDGEGSFGTVFRGWIHESSLTAAKPGSGMAVAVKMLRHEGIQGHAEWMVEVNYMRKLRHPNVVKLIGYCSEENNLLLVYEFVRKGSLDNHLFRRSHQSLSWATRIKVAIGAARGLAFLHDMDKQVIHRNVKSGSILLDENFNAKLADFGLAKDGPTGDMTHVSTRVMGTYGFVAPEYVVTGHLTAKCDVYGFGIVLLELLSGRRAHMSVAKGHGHNLGEWARTYLHNKRKLLQIMDSRMEGEYPHNVAYIVATLALTCLDQNPKLRPRMAEVLVALEQL